MTSRDCPRMNVSNTQTVLDNNNMAMPAFTSTSVVSKNPCNQVDLASSGIHCLISQIDQLSNDIHIMKHDLIQQMERKVNRLRS